MSILKWVLLLSNFLNAIKWAMYHHLTPTHFQEIKMKERQQLCSQTNVLPLPLYSINKHAYCFLWFKINPFPCFTEDSIISKILHSRKGKLFLPLLPPQRIRKENAFRPRYDAMKVLHSTCQEIWKTQQWPQDWKKSVFIPIPKKGNAKECSNYLTIAFISHASKVMLKILQARLQQYVNHELPDIWTGFRKGREPEIKWPTSDESSKKQESSRKISTSALLTMPKPLTVWITTNYGKFLKRWEYQTTWLASWEICMQVRKQWLEQGMEKDWS